jgi:FkbM family methyltransferase
MDPNQIPIGTVNVNVQGRKLPFVFPDTGNMRRNLADIFSGREYPGLPMPQFKPRVIVDVGANVGASALFFHGTFRDATIYCYEPSPTNLSFLKQNVAPVERIKVFDYGLSDRDQQVQLYIGKTHYMQNSVVPNMETQERSETAELRRASTEFAHLGLTEISILKLDTEGCEVPILRDMREMLPASRSRTSSITRRTTGR